MSRGAPARPEGSRWLVAVLGLNLWMLVVGVPLLQQAPAGAAPGAALAAALLSLGVFVLAIASTGAVLRWFAFPCSLLLPLLVHPPLRADEGLGVGPALLVAAAFVAYLVLPGPGAPRRPRGVVAAAVLVVAGALVALATLVHSRGPWGTWGDRTLPGRVEEATTLLAVLGLIAWLTLTWALLRLAGRRCEGGRAVRRAGVLAMTLLLPWGCGEEAAAPGGPGRWLPGVRLAEGAAVVAAVDGHPIPLERLQRAVEAVGAAADPRAVLDDLVTLEVLAREAERQGLAEDPEVRKEARRRAVQRLIEDEFERGTATGDIPEEDLRRSYQENHAFYNNPDVMLVSHLLVPVKGDAPAEKKEEARALAGELRAGVLALEDPTGAALHELAQRHESRWKGLRAENLNWVSRESPLVEEFLDAVFALEADGDVSAPVRTLYGWHVIVREEFEEERSQPFETVVEDVRSRMYPAWRRHRFLRWVDARAAELALVEPGVLRLMGGAPRGGGRGAGAGQRPGAAPRH